MSGLSIEGGSKMLAGLVEAATYASIHTLDPELQGKAEITYNPDGGAAFARPMIPAGATPAGGWSVPALIASTAVATVGQIPAAPSVGDYIRFTADLAGLVGFVDFDGNTAYAAGDTGDWFIREAVNWRKTYPTMMISNSNAHVFQDPATGQDPPRPIYWGLWSESVAGAFLGGALISPVAEDPEDDSVISIPAGGLVIVQPLGVAP